MGRKTYLIRIKDHTKAMNPRVRAMRKLQLILVRLARHPLTKGRSSGFVAFAAGVIKHHNHPQASILPT